MLGLWFLQRSLFFWLALLAALMLGTLAPIAVRAETASRSAPAIDDRSATQVKTKPIRLGTVLPGILDSRDTKMGGHYLEAYRFTGEAGTPVQIRVAGSKDNRPANNLSMSPYLLLYGPNNQLIARTGVAPGTLDAFIRMKLPVSGDYTVVFTNVQPDKPGRYWLAVQYVTPEIASTLTTRPQISENLNEATSATVTGVTREGLRSTP